MPTLNRPPGGSWDKVMLVPWLVNDDACAAT
jgi:hypothetical protein